LGKENLLTHKTFALIFSTNLSAKFLIVRGTERDMTKNVYRAACNVSVNLVVFDGTWIFSTGFWKMLKYQILWKPV